MSGPVEAGCPAWLLQHRIDCPGANTTTTQLLYLKSDLEAASSQNGSAVSYRMPAFCSLAVVPHSEGKNNDQARAASVGM